MVRSTTARTYKQSRAFDLEPTTPAESDRVISPPNTAAKVDARDPLNVLIVVPSLEAGAAEAGVVELVRILATAGHNPIVAAPSGRLEPEIVAAGGEVIALNTASKNPVVMVRNAAALVALIRKYKCHIIHAHGRAPAWSAYLASRVTRVPFLTSWYKGFREQNALKRFYNGVMVRGERVIAISDQIAELINQRYGTPWERIAVVPASVDVARFDPASISRERTDAVRAAWGARPEDRIILVTGRMLRRKGHHVVIQAIARLKAMGLRDFLCVFGGEDDGHSRYTDEIWDLVLASETTDVIRLIEPIDDRPAVYAAAHVVVSAAIQPEGIQRALLEAQAMARPVVVSDMGAGPDIVLAPPAVSEDRMTGLRFSAGDEAALSAALIRLFSMPEQSRLAIGTRGRNWVLTHFDPSAVAEATLRLYGEVARRAV